MKLRLAILCSLLLILSAGCASHPQSPTEDEAPSTVPEFSGPFATELKGAFAEAESDFERKVLEDGKVTDEELAEMQSRLRSCMIDGGAEDITFDEWGGSQVSFPGLSEHAVNELSQHCGAETGEAGISIMYYEMRRNPENLDEFTIMADCLVQKGVVDPSYSAKEYEEWFDSDREWPVESGAGISAFQDCNQDPLGLHE